MEKDLDLDGKKYISARRASEISGYNSDYLGQLCRSGKLECKLVSRSWFVTEKSLRDHQSSNGRKKYGLKNHIVLEDPIFFNQNQKILIDHEKAESWKSSQFSQKNIFDKKLVSGLFLAIVISSLSFSFVWNLNNPVSNSQNNVAFQYTEKVANVLGNYTSKDFQITNLNKERIKENYSNNYLALKNKFKIISLAIFNKNNNYLAQEVFVNENEKVNTPHFAPEDDRGAVMIPVSQSDVLSLSRIRSYLRNSFSDEIEIVPDDSGVSGVIKPVFSDPNDEEYFYVMVPIK